MKNSDVFSTRRSTGQHSSICRMELKRQCTGLHFSESALSVGQLDFTILPQTVVNFLNFFIIFAYAMPIKTVYTSCILNFLGHVMRRHDLENFVATGKVEARRARRRQRIKNIDI